MGENYDVFVLLKKSYLSEIYDAQANCRKVVLNHGLIGMKWKKNYFTQQSCVMTSSYQNNSPSHDSRTNETLM